MWLAGWADERRLAKDERRAIKTPAGAGVVWAFDSAVEILTACRGLDAAQQFVDAYLAQGLLATAGYALTRTDVRVSLHRKTLGER